MSVACVPGCVPRDSALTASSRTLWVVSATIEAKVRELVSAIVARVERDVEIAFERAVADELAQRRNGDAGLEVKTSAEVLDRADEQPSMKVCASCGETNPLDAFPRDPKMTGGRRSVCTVCRNARDRERASQRRASSTSTDDEPAPSQQSPRSTGVVMRAGARLVGRRELADADARRDLLASLRANGVEHEQRGDRTFTVLRLPTFASDERSTSPRIVPRHAQGRARGSPARSSRMSNAR